MGAGDKIRNAAKDVVGKGKEAVGKATHDKRLEAEGHIDQADARVRKAGEDVKDSFRWHPFMRRPILCRSAVACAHRSEHPV